MWARRNRVRAGSPIAVTSRPSISTVPRSARSMPLMRLRSVDLPEPLRPLTATVSPHLTCASAPSSTWCTRPPSRKLRERPRTMSTPELRSAPADACIVETSRIWHCSDIMSASEWRLLTTLSYLPSAQSLAELLAAEGVVVRVMSDAGVLGQAAPSRIYVAAPQLHRARWLLSQGTFTDEELASLSAAAVPANEPPVG